jgi:hypothetical protein
MKTTAVDYTDIRFERVLWLMPLVYLPHIWEEFQAHFPRYITEVMHGTPMPPWLFLLNNALFMLILLGLCSWASRSRTQLSAFVLMSWASGHLFWDFTLHLGYTAWTGVYFPGLVTAALLYYPVAIAVSALAVRQGRLSPARLSVAYLVGAVLLGLVVWAGIYHFHQFHR